MSTTSFSWIPLFLILGLAGIAVFILIQWAWPDLRRLFRRPDLRGTWAGALRSEWVNPATHQRLGPIEAFLVIRQSLWSLHIRQITAESESITKTAAFEQQADGIILVTGTYSNDPKNAFRYRSLHHYGAIWLRVGGKPPKTLKGHYWTDRSTKGDMEFWRVSPHAEDDIEAARQMAKEAGIDAVERMVLAEVDDVLREKALPQGRLHLTDADVHRLMDAAISCPLGRDALMAGLEAGFAGSLPISKTPNEQMLSDLHHLNRCGSLRDGSIPLKIWLANAARLASGRTEEEIFRRYLTQLEDKST